ncbi:HesA/MoeB/ThiF family protein [Paradevosia shaoguanensis]|uniref:Molybdopterin-synthase adenylyltransferase MoeB n=1 Tax=Paradevosia shaoguanensis TaxID=1335043 RepID=A0AA41QPV4_9HYPH|nr:molybdopterin-synthase adenylyltransferase MoeB [Paradevosia shaoguanensis]MCF1744012.1 molybdopterin-synthase adenylyltransferase MoeB [Paradevosia shaoguanensis]MCI0128495.1 molybdopterin-synthase adenylyltransferase MoeB [Paradevosia shaoguanensis]
MPSALKGPTGAFSPCRWSTDVTEPLTPEETRRYARHIVLKGVGGEGQQKLKAARVGVIGAGGLGSPVIAYLAAAGVGTLVIVDDDAVSLSNLQRQIVHRSGDIGRAKAESAEGFVATLNAHVEVLPVVARLDGGNAASVLAGCDVIVEGTDRFDSRLVAAGAGEALRVPVVSGAVSMFDGQVTVFAPHRQDASGRAYPRFRDLYPDDPEEGDLPPCEVVGVLGAVTGVIGTLMAMEAIKLITGLGEPLLGRLLLYDGRAARFTELAY